MWRKRVERKFSPVRGNDFLVVDKNSIARELLVILKQNNRANIRKFKLLKECNENHRMLTIKKLNNCDLLIKAHNTEDGVLRSS